jgi:transcriptional regulator with XRE-family HTH domain
MKRGRPKGRSRDNRSFGPLGDLIRKHRLEKRMGLLDVAKACQCSVQFISNIEHGRAPLPWDKVDQLAGFLKIPVEQLQAANFSIRSDFKSFVSVTGAVGKKARAVAPIQLNGMTGAASAVAATAKDAGLREILERYQTATAASRKKFVKAALRMLDVSAN